MARDGRLVDARQRAAHQVLGERAQILQRRRGFFSEIEPVGAPVGRIVAPLDEAGGRQLVDQPPERDRREVERLGEFVLLRALAALQAREHRPLRAGRAEFAGALVGIGPEQARDVMERESQLAIGREGSVCEQAIT